MNSCLLKPEKAKDLEKKCFKPGMMGHTCNPSTEEAEAGGSQVRGQSGLQSKTLSGNEFFLKSKTGLRDVAQ
jgi:hypothetical protein